MEMITYRDGRSYGNSVMGGAKVTGCRGKGQKVDFLSSLQLSTSSYTDRSELFQNSWHGETQNSTFLKLDKIKVASGTNRRRRFCDITMSVRDVIMLPKTVWGSVRGRLQGDQRSESSLTSFSVNTDDDRLSMDGMEQFNVRRPILPAYIRNGKRNSHTQTLSLTAPFLQPLKDLDVWNSICDVFWRPGLSFCPYEWGTSKPFQWSDLWMKGGGLRGLIMDTYCQDNLDIPDGGSLEEEEQNDQELVELIKLVLRCGPVRVIKCLLSMNIIGLNISLGEAGGLLHIATIARNTEVMVFLCATGIDPKIKDYKGRTASHVIFTAETRRHMPSSYHSTPLPALLPPRVCGMSDKRSIFDMARDPYQLDDLLVKLQTVALDVNREANDEGDYLIHVATKQGVKQTALLMLLVKKHGADVNLVSLHGYTPLMLAVLNSNDVLCQLLICVLGANPDCKEPVTGYTACHLAANYNYYDILSSLVRRGADFNIEGNDGRRPDDVATVAGAKECLEIIQQERHLRISIFKEKILQDALQAKDLKRSDLVTTDEDGETLLVMAARNNSVKSAEVLLNFEATPKDAQLPKTGETAMMIAASCGHVEILKLLLGKGADARIKDMEGLMTIHHAIRGQHLSCVTSLLFSSNPPLTGLQTGLDMTDNAKLHTILQQAKLRRQVEIVRPVLWESAVSGDAAALFCILEEGDDVYAGASPQSENPIYLATSNGHLEVLKLLLEHGGEVMGRFGNAYSTLLHVACQYGHCDVASYILREYRTKMTSAEKLQIINSRNRYGKTALQLAAATGKANLIALLIQEGASTALVNSSGSLYQCSQYEGIQYMIETARKFHTTAVINAVVAKKLEVLKKIWMPKLDHNLRDSHGNTPLMFTCRQGAALIPIIKFLLSSAVYSSTEDEPLPSSSTVITSASRRKTNPAQTEVKVPISVEPSEGSVDSAFELDEGIIEDQENVQPYEAEIYPEKLSSHFQENGRIQSLLESIKLSQTAIFQPGGSISHVCAQNLRDGQTALHYAILAPDGLPVAALLLSTDNSVLNIADCQGLTALHLACKLNKTAMVQLLLNQPEADVNARTLDGQLPEELTIHPAIIKALQSARCQPPQPAQYDLASRQGSTSGASVDFEALNSRFQQVKKCQKNDPDEPPSYKP